MQATSVAADTCEVKPAVLRLKQEGNGDHSKERYKEERGGRGEALQLTLKPHRRLMACLSGT